jgi:hypothetical protein
MVAPANSHGIRSSAQLESSRLESTEGKAFWQEIHEGLL